MNKTFRKQLANIMNLAWQMIRNAGLSKSEALRRAWLNVKLRGAMNLKVVAFTYEKVNGEIRKAFGTLDARVMPHPAGHSRGNESLQVYFDTEKGQYRCFKKANLISATI